MSFCPAQMHGFLWVTWRVCHSLRQEVFCSICVGLFSDILHHQCTQFQIILLEIPVSQNTASKYTLFYFLKGLPRKAYIYSGKVFGWNIWKSKQPYQGGSENVLKRLESKTEPGRLQKHPEPHHYIGAYIKGIQQQKKQPVLHHLLKLLSIHVWHFTLGLQPSS